MCMRCALFAAPSSLSAEPSCWSTTSLSLSLSLSIYLTRMLPIRRTGAEVALLADILSYLIRTPTQIGMGFGKFLARVLFQELGISVRWLEELVGN